MVGILQVITRKADKPVKRSKVELLGNNPLFYKVMTVDKKILRIKRRRWN